MLLVSLKSLLFNLRQVEQAAHQRTAAMSEPYFIRSLELSGFRAYLNPKKFDFSQKRCLAIFAPNGHGKSSLIDALEFLFSKDGTLERLGQRTVNNQAGPVALAHNLAEELKIAPEVSICVQSGQSTTSGTRAAIGANRPIPSVAVAVNSCFAVSPIIRGHTLRAFVESQSPEQRYSDVAHWLQLGPLVDVQKNVRSLRSQVKSAAEDDTELRSVDAQLVKLTANALRTWNTAAVLAYVNDIILAPLDPELRLSGLVDGDPTYLELESRAAAEESELGLASLRQIRSATEILWIETAHVENEKAIIGGAIPTFEAAVESLLAARNAELDERRKAEQSLFKALWEAAEPLFSQEGWAPDVCPICVTPIQNTGAGSSGAIRMHLAQHLKELSDYAVAKDALDSAEVAAANAHIKLVTVLPLLISHLPSYEESLKAKLVTYQADLARWPQTAVPVSTEIQSEIAKLLKKLVEAIAEIESKQGDHTYTKAKAKIERLVDLQAERDLALRKRDELGKLSNALAAQATVISSEIRAKVQALLNELQEPMNDIYKSIQGASAVPIRLELPSEDEANQQRLNLLIDFAKNRSGVPPGGYLSDSQIHSVALALRMAAVRQFNYGAPLIALDDVVTSYDADHRRSISGLIASKFDNCQVLITTHDERFFNYLKDQLEAKTWHFARIIGLDPAYGPRFADHKISDEMIDARWGAGESAANEMRQAEEEWLLGICRDFGVSVRIRPLDRAYTYERSELASALGGMLKEIKLVPSLVAGVNNRFLDSLIKGEIENFGSHFQDGPYGDGSIGDEKARWAEFTAFRGQFACKNCKRTKFKRPIALKRPVCAFEGCEAQFEF